MNVFNLFRSYVAVLLSALSLGAAAEAAPITSAQSCPDTQVVFARGTGEDPGLGPTGQAFAEALGARLGGRPMDVYPINFPASNQWSTRLDGIRDAGAHVVSMASRCPSTKLVLGGYSQGAAVMALSPRPWYQIPYRQTSTRPDPQTTQPRGGQPCSCHRAVRNAERARDEFPRATANRYWAALSGQDH